MKSLRIPTIAISLILWLASLSLPAVVLQMTLPSSSAPGSPRVPGGLDVNTGLQMFGYSFLGFTSLNFAGFANLLLLAGWILLWRRARSRTTRIVLGLALLLTLQTFQLHTGPVYYDEGGTRLGYLHALLPGWYLWVLSIAIPFAVSLLQPDTMSPSGDESG